MWRRHTKLVVMSPENGSKGRRERTRVHLFSSTPAVCFCTTCQLCGLSKVAMWPLEHEASPPPGSCPSRCPWARKRAARPRPVRCKPSFRRRFVSRHLSSVTTCRLLYVLGLLRPTKHVCCVLRHVRPSGERPRPNMWHICVVCLTHDVCVSGGPEEK